MILMSRRDDTLKCLLKKDYKDIKFLKDDGEWCYYQVSTCLLYTSDAADE